MGRFVGIGGKESAIGKEPRGETFETSDTGKEEMVSLD